MEGYGFKNSQWKFAVLKTWITKQEQKKSLDRRDTGLSLNKLEGSDF
jgi:hypothetical protein